jgi:acetyltransferase-like isoleucine patch superfamily enzyme
MLIRKIRSFIKKFSLNINNRINHLKIFFLEENIIIGKNVLIEKNVVIKTTDGGKIFIGDNVCIERNCYIYAQSGKILINKDTFIGFGSQIVAKNYIEVGKNCLIAAYSIIRDANHGINKNKLINSQPHIIDKIIIEDDVWLGAHCVVTAGSKIGKGAVVGANAVVTKNIEPYIVVGGVPAKFIKKR